MMLDPRGPQIYDTDGELVWYGNSYANSRTQDFKVCDYLGEKGTHLCWSERERVPEAHKPIAHKVFIDNTYSFVKNYSTRGDGHEFRIVDEGHSFLTMNYKRVKYDLRPFHGDEAGWIKDACIVEYNAENGTEQFEWCYSDALDLGESKLYFPAPGQDKLIGTKSGRGREFNPWDFAHLNSLDKNSEGDYLASLRHLDSIYKIAGPYSASGKEPGTVLWRLGGKSNDFQMNFNFSKQHDVRYLNVTSTETIISLLDNAWEGVNEPTSNVSSGKIVSINNSTMKAHLLHEYIHPRGKLAGSRGSMQITENGNAFVGWGALPEMSEYSHDGLPLYHSKFALVSSSQFSYRAFKFPWVGKPYWGPKLLPYSYSCLEDKKPLYAYVSWNGATEVKQWRFYEAHQETGPWISAGTVDKDGFETRVRLTETAAYVTVEALDANSTVLATVTRRTFVPHLGVKSKCNEFSCANHFIYNDEASRGHTCTRFYAPATFPFILVLVFFELVCYWSRNVIYSFEDTRPLRCAPSPSKLHREKREDPAAERIEHYTK